VRKRRNKEDKWNRCLVVGFSLALIVFYAKKGCTFVQSGDPVLHTCNFRTYGIPPARPGTASLHNDIAQKLQFCGNVSDSNDVLHCWRRNLS
jgi:hypothetical protein